MPRNGLSRVFFHVLYATKLFCVGSGKDPNSFEDAKNFVDEAIETISVCFDDAKASAYRFFRLVGTRQIIEEAVMRQIALGRHPARLNVKQPDFFDLLSEPN
jgi:hypothetical protein